MKIHLSGILSKKYTSLCDLKDHTPGETYDIWRVEGDDGRRVRIHSTDYTVDVAHLSALSREGVSVLPCKTCLKKLDEAREKAFAQ